MAVASFDDILQYRGRAARRSDSRIRRKAILEAALRVIERDGVRGVKHRAVASEAGVPLAATTYYFDDIQSLLHDAFVHYVETRLSTDSARLQNQAYSLVAGYGIQSKTLTEQQLLDLRRQLAQGVSDVMLAHVRSQVERAAERRVEVAFRYEALRNRDLAKVVTVPRRVQLEAIQGFFSVLGSHDARSDAQVVMGTILYLEYSLSLSGGDADWALANSTLQRMVEGLLRLPEL